jgi:hypothetical protein
MSTLIRLPVRQFSFCEVRLRAKRQPQHARTSNRLALCGQAAAGRDDTTGVRVKMSRCPRSEIAFMRGYVKTRDL